MKSDSKVKLISECFIKPNPEVVDEASKKPYHLNPRDLALLSSYYIRKGLLYNKPCDKHYQTQVFLQKLKHSLSLTLHHFYPLAGRFATQTLPDEHACCIYIDCVNDGAGARFIHASLDSTVSDILSSTDVHPSVISFFDQGEQAINHDGHTKALLSVQVTELLDGMFIGFSMNHSVADGTSHAHFITTLSEIFNSVGSLNGGETYDISGKPIFKPFFPDGYGPILKLPFIVPEEFISRYDEAGPVREKAFRFSRASMSSLKAKVNNSESNINEMISSFKALSCLIWRAITRARKLDPEKDTNCGLPINSRPRLNPPLTQEYFGNYFTGSKATCKVGELLGSDLGWAAFLLHESVKKQDDKAIRQGLRRYAGAPFVIQPGNGSAFFGANFVKILGSPRFDFFGTEFGMGKPIAVRFGYAKTDGRVAVSQGRDGEGSVDIEVCLVPPTMSALEADEEFMSFVTLG